jgi:ADP-ribose pyrophosphatase YjhB (NUDIX family)
LRPAFFHTVLSSLSTLERVVFVLHDGFEWPYLDVARLLGRSEAAVRQLRHRAHHHLASGVERFAVEPGAVDAVAAAYVHVSAGSDVFELVERLAPGLASRAPTFWCHDRKIVHDVAGIVLFREDRLLLGHRRERLAWFPGGWDLPGSHRRHGEPAIACAVRAARQELDVHVANPHQVVELSESDFRLTLFEADRWTGEPRNHATEQHDDIGLFTREQASDLQLIDRRLLSLFDQAAA